MVPRSHETVFMSLRDQIVFCCDQSYDVLISHIGFENGLNSGVRNPVVLGNCCVSSNHA